MLIDEGLRQFATPRQGEYIDAVNKHGGWRAAGRALKMSEGTIRRALKTVKRRAVLQGYSPEHGLTKVVPPPFVVRGTSTLYDKEGNQQLQWVKTRLDEQQVEEAIRAAVEALAQDVARAKPTKAPKDVSAALANLYTVTDTHIGMKSWPDETGADWDLNIAENTLGAAFLQLIESTPRAAVGIVNLLGDIMHYDSLDAVTPQHRNLLDADSRYPKMVQVAVRILRRIIDATLLRHDKVIVSFQEGNHDMASTVWLRHLFGLLYENEPRVEVVDCITPYYAMSWGMTMLAFHHGHLSKNTALPMLFAAEYPQIWGATTRRYCHTGHRHHSEEKEHGGMTVIQHPTLAARDAYAARGGWTADRAMTAITYHSRFGQVGRTTVVPEMLEICK